METKITIIQQNQDKFQDAWKDFDELGVELINQINKVREDPKSATTQDVYTREFLDGCPKLKLLENNAQLKKAAIDHYRDIASQGLQSHTGSDSSTYKDRIERYAQWGGAIYESIVYKYSVPDLSKKQEIAQKILNEWLVDRSLPQKNNRKNVMAEHHSHISIVCGPHSKVGFCYVAMFAAQIVSKQATNL